MATKEQIKESLDSILVPAVNRSLVGLNIIRKINVTDGRVRINLASPALDMDIQNWIKMKVKETTEKLPEVTEVEANFIECSPKDLNEITSVIAVMSGKGGVGKSLVTALMAVALARQGKHVGILDADITGPSIPKMFGIGNARPKGNEAGILPVLSRSGITIMSLNLLLEHEDDAVIWRGPLIAGAIKQFWEEVLWGKLDYLLIDLPPGTADASLTVMQSLPLSGVVIVFSPQELAAMVVRKSVQMTQKMEIPILGVVENMSYLILPDSGKKLEIFGKSKAKEMAKAAGAPLLGQIPIDPELARLCDEGEIERYQTDLTNSFADSIAKALTTRGKVANRE
jgi:Mrp family chromosome partitioning ATPase